MSNVSTNQPSIDRDNQSFVINELIRPEYAECGFLPASDPLPAFPRNSEYALLDEIGRDLPQLLADNACRKKLQQLTIPKWNESVNEENIPALRLYYVRLGFIASAYINQIGQPPCHILPANIAVPLAHVCTLLDRPPILSYDGYALYNWQRLDIDAPIALGNIETIQNFVLLYDEHWFILIHVEIEAIAAQILACVRNIALALKNSRVTDLSIELTQIAGALQRQISVLQRIPEKMDPQRYFKDFRPYIRFFENVTYQGVTQQQINFRGETGAQSSIMPVLVALLKIPHQQSILTQHLHDMRKYMPAQHRLYLQQVALLPSIRQKQHKEAFNTVLQNIIRFREMHLGWANEYIHKHLKDPRGTGGTPYRQWLKQLIDETAAYQI